MGRVTVTAQHCDRACVSVGNFVYLGERGGRAWRVEVDGVTVSSIWSEWLQGHIYASSSWQHRPGSIPQVGWGLIVVLKYSWAHRVDKWRYKNTEIFNRSDVADFTGYNLLCDLTFAGMPINILRAWKKTLMAFSICALWSNLHWDGYRQDERCSVIKRSTLWGCLIYVWIYIILT